MKKYILIISLLFACKVQAGLITIGLSDNNVVLGDSITINLTASDFDPFDTFDFDFTYDNSLFTFDAVSFSSDLSFGFPFIFTANENLNGLAISFVDFVPYMNADFLLASFQLTAKSAGLANFSLSNVRFADFGTSVTVDSSALASANINAEVPEPSTWLLLLSALIMIGRINRSV